MEQEKYFDFLVVKHVDHLLSKAYIIRGPAGKSFCACCGANAKLSETLNHKEDCPIIQFKNYRYKEFGE